jgi:hypothetical protein
VYATGFGRPQQCADILGAVQEIEQEEKRPFPPSFSQSQYLFHRAIKIGADFQDYPLVAAVSGKLAQTVFVAFLDRNLPLAGGFIEGLEIFSPSFDPQPVNVAAAAAQRFQNGVTTVEILDAHYGPPIMGCY